MEEQILPSGMVEQQRLRFVMNLINHFISFYSIAIVQGYEGKGRGDERLHRSMCIKIKNN